MITDAEVVAALDEWMGQARLFMFNQFFGVENEVESESVRRERLRPWMRAALTAARAVADAEGWRGIESAPRDGAAVLIAKGDDQWVACCMTAIEDNSVEWVTYRRNGADPIAVIVPAPTHWRPLPAAPKEAG